MNGSATMSMGEWVRMQLDKAPSPSPSMLAQLSALRSTPDRVAEGRNASHLKATA